MKTLDEKLSTKFRINATSGCWEWTSSRSTKGYGMISAGGSKWFAAHRVAYEIYIGPIPTGLQLDHLCRVRHCVNPEHLEPVTARENVRRGQGPAGINAAKTHCPQGHEYTEENTYRNPSRNSRMCRICIREHEIKRYDRARRLSTNN